LEVTKASGRVEIPVSKRAAGARLFVGEKGIVLAVPHDPRDLPLRPAKPTVLAGCVLPLSDATWNWTSATKRGVAIEHVMSDSFVDAPRLAETVPCAALSLGEKRFDAEKFLALGEAPSLRNIDAKKRFGISTSPSGPPALSLTIGVREGGEVQVFRQDQGRSLISLMTDRELVFGWVDSKVLSNGPTNPLASIGLGLFGIGGGGIRPRDTWPKCTTDLDLIGVRGSERQVVGTLGANTPFFVDAERDDLAIVELGADWFTLSDGAALALLADDVGRYCSGE
jgi:hypothetical protein